MSMWHVCECKVKTSDMPTQPISGPALLYAYDDLGVTRVYHGNQMIEIPKTAMMLMVGQFIQRELMRRVESMDQSECVDLLIDAMIAKRVKP